jgi:pimeloyl-ACP methyl ester carboxylesterase
MNRRGGGSAGAGTRRRLAAACVVVAVVAGGCSSGDGGSVEAGTGMHLARESDVFSLPEGSAFEPAPCPLRPTVPTESTLQCGVLRAPERRDDPAAGEVEVAVLILRSTAEDPAPDPIVYLEGGPGGSSLPALDFWVESLAPVLEKRDVILVDQRGTGFSKPLLTCDDEYADAFLFSTTTEILQRCIGRLDGEGVDRSAYTTRESADDLKLLRESLGLEQWNLYGVSYGTRLALAAMAADPMGIKTVTLDSAYPTGVDPYLDLPSNAQRSFAAVFAACRADPACDGAYPDLENRFYGALEGLELEPLILDGTHPTNGSNLRYALTGSGLVQILFQALYLYDVIPDVPKALDAAIEGDGQPVWDLLIGPGFPDPDEIEAFEEEALDLGIESFPPSIADGMHLSVQCTEEIPFTDMAALESRLDELPFELAFALGGTVYSLEEQCGVWNVPAWNIDEIEPAINRDIPTLVLAGNFDPITPPEWGQLAAGKLNRATFLQVDAVGHAVIGAGECAGQIISSFADDPDTFDPNQCTVPPPSFTVD